MDARQLNPERSQLRRHNGKDLSRSLLRSGRAALQRALLSFREAVRLRVKIGRTAWKHRLALLTVESGKVDLRQALQEAVDSGKPLMVERRHLLETIQPDKALVADGDPLRLVQVVAVCLPGHGHAATPRSGGRTGARTVELDHPFCVAVERRS